MARSPGPIASSAAVTKRFENTPRPSLGVGTMMKVRSLSATATPKSVVAKRLPRPRSMVSWSCGSSTGARPTASDAT